MYILLLIVFIISFIFNCNLFHLSTVYPITTISCAAFPLLLSPERRGRSGSTAPKLGNRGEQELGGHPHP